MLKLHITKVKEIWLQKSLAEKMDKEVSLSSGKGYFTSWFRLAA
jgi:hypothetical protein